MDLSAFRAAWAAEEEAIERGIRENRTSDATLRVVDANGAAVPGARVKVRQLTHDFLFGCNAVMMGQYKEEAQEMAWENAFTRLFNHATTTLCRGVYEPTPGVYRFEDNGDEDSRRPPINRLAHWSWATGLHTKGQPLLAGSWHPKWAMNQSRAEAMESYRGWFQRVAEHADGRFEMYDVVNEAFLHKNFPLYTEDLSYVDEAFAMAAPLFDKSVKLCLNEHSAVNGPCEIADRYYALAKRIVDKGIRIDGIGLQYHLFSNDELSSFLRLERWSPSDMRKTYERYATLGIPLYITEITMPSTLGATLEEGEALQAEIARKLYRFWFSLPWFKGITWWNLADGLAWLNEGSVRGALLDADLREKPAYQALYQLIRREWMTSTEGETKADGTFAFRGFHGEYEATITAADGSVTTQKFRVGPEAGETRSEKRETRSEKRETRSVDVQLAAAPAIRWVDASTLTVEGRPFTDALGPWARIPRDLIPALPPNVREMSNHATGMLVRFTPQCAQWTFRARVARNHDWNRHIGTIASAAGFDVYSREPDGSFRYHANVAPSAFSRRLGAAEVQQTFDWTPGVEAWIYFPSAARVWSCEIGVPADADPATVLAPPAPRASGVVKPVVHYGTSIAHGAFASRPALCHTALEARIADVPLVNLGFSGSARLEMPIAEAMARIDASLYIVDPCWNATDDEMKERFKPFVRYLLSKHPNTPILCPAPCSCEFAQVGFGRTDRMLRRTAILDKLYAELREEFPTAPLHYLSNADMLPQTTDATCDHAHPNDVGHLSMGRVFAKAIREIVV